MSAIVPCPICKQPLKEVVQDSNSMLNSDQFDSLKPGDWYCEMCAPDEEYRYKYWRNSQVLIGKSTIDEVTPAFVEALTCEFVDGCTELGLDLYKLTQSTIKILEAVWNKARHTIPPEKEPADLLGVLHLQGAINRMCEPVASILPELQYSIVDFVLTSKLVRADYRAVYEGIKK